MAVAPSICGEGFPIDAGSKEGSIDAGSKEEGSAAATGAEVTMSLALAQDLDGATSGIKVSVLASFSAIVIAAATADGPFAVRFLSLEAEDVARGCRGGGWPMKATGDGSLGSIHGCQDSASPSVLRAMSRSCSSPNKTGASSL